MPVKNPQKEAVEVAAEFLKENEGKVADYRVEQTVRSVGGKISRDTVAEIRKSLGFAPYPGRNGEGIATIKVPEPVPGSKRVRVFGGLAMAARRKEVGIPIRGQGSICQEIGEEYLGLVKAEAARMAVLATHASAEARNSKREARETEEAHVPSRKRKRWPSDLGKARPMIVALLEGSKGRMRNSEIVRALHANGIGINSSRISEIRKELGFKKPYKLDPHGPTEPVVAPPPNTSMAPEAARDAHPLVTLISNLAENFGLTYLHWERGGEVVFREEQERRFKL